MSEEKRLLDTEEAGSLAGQLLRSGAELRLDAGRKDRLWRDIARQLPPPPDGGAGPGGGAPPAAGEISVLGSFKIGAAVGFALAGAWWAWEAATTPPPRPPERPALVASAEPPSPRASAAPLPPQASAEPPSRASAAPSAVSAPRPALTTREAPSEPPATPAASAEPPQAPAAASSSPPPASSAEIARQERLERMREETEMTRAARAALRSGNAPEALRLLGEIQAKFGGRGVLSQEREALTIEALARTGQGDQARTRAQAFLLAYPSSPFAQDVQSFAR